MAVTSLDERLCGLQDSLEINLEHKIEQKHKYLYAQILQHIPSKGIREELAAISHISEVSNNLLEVQIYKETDTTRNSCLHRKLQDCFSYHFNLPVQLTLSCISPQNYEEDTDYRPEDPSINTSGLTEEQAIALQDLMEFIRDDNQSFYRIKGYAGTGKSWLICSFIQELNDFGCSHLAACPTNKAVKNLKEIARQRGLQLEIKTIAQLLGQVPELNTTTGKEDFISNDTDFFEQYSVILVDEFSMICKQDFLDIIESSYKYNTKIIFVGDEAQLPPVKEKEPIAATYEMPESVLSQVVRYDGEIARVAEAIRTNNFFGFETTKDETITCLVGNDWLSRAIAAFDSEEFAENPDYIRLLAWRNATVKRLNAAVRAHLWGQDAPTYIAGDRLIALKPLFAPNPGASKYNKWQIHLGNSEEMLVCEEGTLSMLDYDSEQYKFWNVKVRSDSDNKQFTAKILHEDSLKQHKKKVKHYVDKKQWSNYYDLTKGFDNIGYAYALTVHKAQGSTINNVYLDASDMRFSDDKSKLLYTALTRTKDRAYVLN